jgi:hypothetical protein
MPHRIRLRLGCFRAGKLFSVPLRIPGLQQKSIAIEEGATHYVPFLDPQQNTRLHINTETKQTHPYYFTAFGKP